jgi:PBSX family phage terminase large subunit
VLAVPQNKGATSIIDATGRLNIWEGSVRSSKTVDANIAWLNFVATCPPGPLLMTGKTRDTVHRNILDPMSEWLPEEDFDPHQNEIEIFGRPVYIVGANDEKAVKKIQGLTLIGAYADEIATLPESYFKMLLSRLSLSGAKFFGTTNPDSPYHWLKVEYLDKLKPPHLNQFHFILEDNPHLPPEYVAALKEEYVGLWYRRYILGEWCLAEGSVYDMWDEKTHVIKDLPPSFDWYYTAIDYGTANAPAFLYNGVTVDKITGDKVTCIKEYYHDGHTSKQKTDMDLYYDLHAFLRGIPNRWIILDPSALSLKTQLRKNERCRDCGGAGCPTCDNKGTLSAFDGIKDADNDVLNGIRTLSSFLQNGRYRVHESCKNHRREFGGYRWNPKAQLEGEDVPKKVDDHTMDTARYGVHTLFKKPGQPRVLKRFI